MENPTTLIKKFNARQFLSSILYPNTICFRVILVSIPKPFIFNEMMMRFALCQTNTLSWSFIVREQTCRSTRAHYSDSEPTSQCSFSLMLVLSGEAINTNFKVFGLTQPGLEPTIYRTQGEQPSMRCGDTDKKKHR